MKKGVIAALIILAACAEEKKKLDGERVSIFNAPIVAADGGGAQAGSIKLARPIITRGWESESRTDANIAGHLGGRQDMEPLFTASVGTSNKTSLILYPPVADREAAYAIDGDLNIAKISLATGEKVWRNNTLSSEALLTFGALALDSDYLYAITNDAVAVKLDKASGEIIWKKSYKGTLKSGAKVCNGRLMFATDADELVVLSASTGEKVFTHRSLENPFGFIKGSTPACADGRAVAAFSNGEVHLIDLATGKLLWMAQAYRQSLTSINNMSDIVANPVLLSDRVIIKSYGGVMKALSLADGSEIWSLAYGGVATPAVSNSTIFDVDGDRIVRAIDAITGGVLWSLKLEGADKAALMNPLLVNSRLIIMAGNGSAVVIDPYTGSLLKQMSFGGTIDSSPIMVWDKMVVIGDGNLIVWR
ncbi:MAG: PQQ-binding-like beta-propeller repeat protein [Rickettsiales bacterium]|jgi:outer membrane protein assembly factor BamB|nr:PQQ-binding-like beta-propeller repeat protein [Rickettsiales bacterium]